MGEEKSIVPTPTDDEPHLLVTREELNQIVQEARQVLAENRKLAVIKPLPRSILQMSEQDLHRLKTLAEMVSNSQLAINKNGSSKMTPGDVMIIFLKGLSLGMTEMQALESIDLIAGKPCLDAQGMLALIHASGELEDIQFDVDDNRAICTIKRHGKSAHIEEFGVKEATEYMTSEWVSGQKTIIPLIEKQNYKNQRRVMFKWRAGTAAFRVMFADVIQGLYTPDELGANVIIDDDGRMTIVEVPPAQPSQKTPPELPATVPGKGNPSAEPASGDAPPAGGQPVPWAKANWKMFVASCRKETGGWEEIVPQLVKEKGISDINKPEQWDKAFPTGREAAVFVKEAFQRTMEAAPPAKPKDVDDLLPALDEAGLEALRKHLREDYWSLDEAQALDHIGAPDWSGFKTLDEAKAAVRTGAIAATEPVIAYKARFNHNYTDFYTVLGTIRLYGRDEIRSLGEKWAAYTDRWQKGKMYTFADASLNPLGVFWHWEGEGDKRYLAVDKPDGLTIADEQSRVAF